MSKISSHPTLVESKEKVKIITLQDIKIKCSKCNSEYSYNESCPKCQPSEPPKPEYDLIVYDIPEHLKLVSKIKEFVEITPVYNKNIKIELYKESIKFIGQRSKFGKIIDDDFTIEFNDDNCISQLKDLLTHVEEWKDIIIEGHNKFNISPNKFLFSSRYRGTYYDFDLKRFSVVKNKNWRLIIGMICTLFLGIGSDIIQREVREYLNN